MIENKNQFRPQKILPKKPSTTSFQSQDSIFYDTFPGEFHTSWEHDLWDVDVVPEDLDLDGLEKHTHIQSFVPSKEPQLSSDPMLSDVINKNNSNQNETNRESNPNNETVLFEMIVDHTDILPLQDALISTNSLRDECIEDMSQDSVGFNESSESGFDNSFCGWDPASMLESNSNDSSNEDILYTALTKTFPQQRLQAQQQDIPTPELSDTNQKKRVGRPRKTSIHTVASVPVKGPKKLIENMKRRRQRDLNNIASQKCRAKKKEELLKEAKDCQHQELRNKELKSQEKFLRERVERLRNILIRNGYCLPNLSVGH